MSVPDAVRRSPTASALAFALGRTPHPHLSRAVREKAELEVQGSLPCSEQKAHRLRGANDARERGDERDRWREVGTRILLVKVETGRAAAHALAASARLL